MPKKKPQPQDTDILTTKTLNALPGLVGAIDQAIHAELGDRLPFSLVIYLPQGGAYASNGDAEEMKAALKEFAGQL